jgi:hypothetical protein
MTETIRIARKLHRGGRAFLSDARGLAAIEMALILPIADADEPGRLWWPKPIACSASDVGGDPVANIFAQANNTNASTITEAEKNQILAYPTGLPYDGSTAGLLYRNC